MGTIGKMGVFAGLLLIAGQLLAGPEGHFRGEAGNQALSADLELLDTSLVGILVVGDVRYLVNASRQGDVYRGQANNMLDGKSANLLIQPRNKAIQVQLDSRQLQLYSAR